MPCGKRGRTTETYSSWPTILKKSPWNIQCIFNEIKCVDICDMDQQVQYLVLYNFYKDSCPMIGLIAFIITTIYRIKWKNVLLHSRLDRQECKNYLLSLSLFTFILVCSVFPIQSSDICSKTRLIKTTCETPRRSNATGAVPAFSVTQAFL